MHEYFCLFLEKNRLKYLKYYNLIVTTIFYFQAECQPDIINVFDLPTCINNNRSRDLLNAMYQNTESENFCEQCLQLLKKLYVLCIFLKNLREWVPVFLGKNETKFGLD